jgi:AraC-like DNA-binding protein
MALPARPYERDTVPGMVPLTLVRLLACENLGAALAEVGALLGCSEQSAFSRAFKRWTGSAPLNWRQGQNPDPMASRRC